MRPDLAIASKALNDLFRTYPGFKPDDLQATVRVYLEAVSEYETRDVEQGIHDFITGNVPGHNPSYAPSAPEVGSACRRALIRRLEAERLDKLALPPPPDVFEQDPPEVRAKNKARLEALAASLASSMRTDEAEGNRIRQEIGSKTNMRFAPSYDHAAMAKRLGVGTGYSVGDPDEQNGDMGTRGAA
jgi:hypothetical protein